MQPRSLLTRELTRLAGSSEGQRSSGMMAGLGGVSQQKHTRCGTCSFTTQLRLHNHHSSFVACCLLFQALLLKLVHYRIPADSWSG